MCLGIPGQVVDLDGVESHLATVEVSGVRRQINVGLVLGDEGGLEVGDWVLIHVGFAMARIDEEEAARELEFMQQMEDVWNGELAQFEGSGLSES